MRIKGHGYPVFEDGFVFRYLKSLYIFITEEIPEDFVFLKYVMFSGVWT